MPVKKRRAASKLRQPENPSSLEKIEHIVVLMLENRSFDHLIGIMKSGDPRIEGLNGTEFNNDPVKGSCAVWNAKEYKMPFDPGHEFDDVQIQLYGPSGRPTPPNKSAPMSGFLSNSLNAAKNSTNPDDYKMVMEYFRPEQVPVLSTLAREFALCNFWYSSLPGPTWPNRFFVHAATSGGLTKSPNWLKAGLGFSFVNGTIYERLSDAGKDWRIYHDSWPQSIGIDSLRGQYIALFNKHYREMNYFEEDLKDNLLPQYVFIEPDYDVSNSYRNGNSMHPLNDVRDGEKLIKRVYEGLRNSSYWGNTMLVVVFDEHGGFYDHGSPVSAIPPGDKSGYKDNKFAFDLLGVRVPSIVISPFTARGTVIGRDNGGNCIVFDHTSILSTVEKKFGLKPLTNRDAAARTLEVALNLQSPRMAPGDAPLTLPSPPRDSLFKMVKDFFVKAPAAASGNALLSDNQKSFLSLARKCDLEMNDAGQHDKINSRVEAIKTQKDAASYMHEVDEKIRARRKARIN
jgi:phospholipase C